MPSDWQINTLPGENGVDAEYIGPADRNPGFTYAELKPVAPDGSGISPSALDGFGDQLEDWDLSPGETRLWLYNQNGVIGDSGYQF